MAVQKTSSMKIKSYLDLYALLSADTSSREENRAFGLEHMAFQKQPVTQLLTWKDTHIAALRMPTQGDTVTRYLYGITLTLVLIALVLGFVSGLGLLAYSGHEPVNVIYFMAMVIAVPLFTMSLTLISMLRANSAQSLLVHISPAFWMEKLLSFLPQKMQVNMNDMTINPLLLNWMIIKRSQWIALFFSLGLLLALLMMVITKDIAFAWSTTLHISPVAFHTFLESLALPWREWMPSAVPSVALIEQSHYFRLGDRLSKEMINHANILGEWWKFLLMATLFYAVFLRLLMFVVASIGFNRAMKKSLLTLTGASKLLREMNEPIISTRAQNDEDIFVPTAESYGQIVHRLDNAYDSIHGWAIDKENLVVLSDSMHLVAPQFYEVGGANTLDEDNAIRAKSHGKILFFVKGWEPPTMDFVDYLEALADAVEKVVLFPVGTVENGYKIDASYVDIWDRKLTLVNKANVWLKR